MTDILHHGGPPIAAVGYGPAITQCQIVQPPPPTSNTAHPPRPGLGRSALREPDRPLGRSTVCGKALLLDHEGDSRSESWDILGIAKGLLAPDSGHRGDACCLCSGSQTVRQLRRITNTR